MLELAKRSETAIYAIGLRTRGHRSSRGFQEAEYVLRQLSQETGGRVFFPDSIDELTDIYGQIADELSSQYTIGYTSKNPLRDGQWHRIIVQSTRPSATARDEAGLLRADVEVTPHGQPRLPRVASSCQSREAE